MQLEQVGNRGILPALRGVLWGALAAGMALALALQAWRSGRETAGLRRQSSDLERRAAALQAANRALRSEVRALNSDPVYVESVVRGWRRLGAGERAVD